MRSQTRYVLIIVAILTAFSLCTIISNRSSLNYQRERGDESTVRYDEAEEAIFLEQDDEASSSPRPPPPLPSSSPAPRYSSVRKHPRTPRAEKLIVGQGEEPNFKPYLRDVLSEPGRGVDKFDFRSCGMSNCFDYSRCKPREPLKVHIVSSPALSDTSDLQLNMSGESNMIHQNILKIIRNSEHFEPNPEKACIFVLEDDTLDRDPLSSSFRPNIHDLFQAKYGFGMNYLVFNLYSGSWPDYKEDDFSGFRIGAALLAKASNGQAHHRQNFDISIPLFSYLHPATSAQDERDIDATDGAAVPGLFEHRKSYFLSFKGKRYVIGSGSDTRNGLYHLNNQRDVVMLTTCKHGKKWREVKDARCAEEEVSYNQHDFVELMRNSTFCLTPRGRRLGSFRFLEALSYGCIPVILSDGWVWPFGEIIDWSDAALQFPEDQILLVPDLLRDISFEQIVRMRHKSHQLYRKYFSTIEKIVLTTLSIVETRIRNKSV